jgi:hypothetical protein
MTITRTIPLPLFTIHNGVLVELPSPFSLVVMTEERWENQQGESDELDN